ncbi:hypothetical protein CSKR_109515, partial [Clonorchis sinensis]
MRLSIPTRDEESSKLLRPKKAEARLLRSINATLNEVRCIREIHSFAYQFGFCERLTWNPAESPVCDVFRQLNVLHQAASCSSCYDIRDIAIHVYTRNALLIRLLKALRQPTT